MNNAAFLIWAPVPMRHVRVVTEPNQSEQEILRLPLAEPSNGGKEDLIFFHTGGTTLRVVRTMVLDGPASPYHVVERLNNHIDRLIPYHTIADNPKRALIQLQQLAFTVVMKPEGQLSK